VLCVVQGSGLCDELITRSEESYRVDPHSFSPADRRCDLHIPPPVHSLLSVQCTHLGGPSHASHHSAVNLRACCQSASFLQRSVACNSADRNEDVLPLGTYTVGGGVGTWRLPACVRHPYGLRFKNIMFRGRGMIVFRHLTGQKNGY
jgi:hypothetical protein